MVQSDGVECQFLGGLWRQSTRDVTVDQVFQRPLKHESVFSSYFMTKRRKKSCFLSKKYYKTKLNPTINLTLTLFISQYFTVLDTGSVHEEFKREANMKKRGAAQDFCTLLYTYYWLKQTRNTRHSHPLLSVFNYEAFFHCSECLTCDLCIHMLCASLCVET